MRDGGNEIWGRMHAPATLPRDVERGVAIRRAGGEGAEGLRYHIAQVWEQERYSPPTYRDGDLRIKEKRSKLVSYARESIINNPLYQRLIGILCDYVLGPDGAELLLDAPNLDAAAKKRVEAAWDVWCERCDAREEQTFAGIEREVLAELINVGEVLVLINKDLTLSIVPSEQIDDAERDRAGRVRYYRYHWRGADGEVHEEKVAPADAIYLYRKCQPDQTRGVGLLWSSFVYIFYMDNLLKNASKSATEAAKWVMVLTSPDAGGLYTPAPAPGSGEAKPSPRNTFKANVENTSAGMMVNVVPGSDAKVINNPKPEPQLEQGLRPFLKLICASAGVPLDLVLADYGNQSYSSSKSLSLHLQASLSVIGHMLVNKFYRKIFARCVDKQARPSFVLPRLRTVDELKEAQADEARVRAGLATQTQVLKEKNLDFGEQLATRERELLALWEAAKRLADKTGGAVSAEAFFAKISGVAANAK